MLKGKNNAYGTLYEAITSTDTTCKIVKPNSFTSGTSIEVPFLLTIFDKSMSQLMLNFEIVKVTAIELGITFDTLTIERSQENTPALNHGAGKSCGNLITWGYFVGAFAGVQEAIDEAREAVEIVSNAHLYPPYIGENGNWYVYDVVNHEYVDTGDQAQGPQGPAGEGDGDMKKEIYDTNNSGIVDNSERLGNELPSFYASNNEIKSIDTGSITENTNQVVSMPSDAVRGKLDVILKGNTDSSAQGSKGVFKSVGKNLFNKNGVTNGYFYSNVGVKTTSATYCYSDNIYVKPSALYRIGGTSLNVTFYDSGGNSIGYYSGTASFTTPSNIKYCIISSLIADINGIQLEQGSTVTAYETYRETSIEYNLHKLPNGVYDEKGNGKAVKRIKEYILPGASINELNTASYTNIDLVVIPISNMSDMVGVGTTDTVATKVLTSVSNPRNGVTLDSVGMQWRHTITATALSIAVPKGTYGNLAAAQTALAGTKIIYELSQPIVTEVVPLIAEKNGTIIVEPNASPMPSWSATYPKNVGAQIDGLNGAVAELSNADKANVKKNTELQWINATLQNGWTGLLQYAKDDLGNFYLRGVLVSGTITAGTVIATLPNGYYPSFSGIAISAYNTTSLGVSPVFSLSSANGQLAVRGSIVTANGFQFQETYR